MEQGITNGCFMESVIEKAPGIGLDRNATGYVCIVSMGSVLLTRFCIRQLGGTLIEGGSDTTSAFILTLILALVNAPEAQRLAQEEIDRIIGAERAPLLDDIDSLPYAQALIKEVVITNPQLKCRVHSTHCFLQVHRWRPVAPLALPHASTEDITYREWLLPKGTAFFMNVCTVSSYFYLRQQHSSLANQGAYSTIQKCFPNLPNSTLEGGSRKTWLQIVPTIWFLVGLVCVSFLHFQSHV